MKTLGVMGKLPMLIVGLLCVGIAGCDLIRQAILSDLPDDTDADPLRVTT